VPGLRRLRHPQGRAEGAGRPLGGPGEDRVRLRHRLRRARARGIDVAHVHIRHIWPLPGNLGDLLRSFGRVIVPEMNNGQLKTLLRDQYLVDARPLTKVSGQPFKIREIEAAIEEALA